MVVLNNTADFRILVVDDRKEVLRVMSDLLERQGFFVRTAQNGLDALNRIKSDRYISLVLLDLWMPIMDGYEFLWRKKTDPDIAEIPVVVISATPPTSLEGVEKVLTKPIDLEQLMETVRRYFWSREISIRDRASATD